MCSLQSTPLFSEVPKEHKCASCVMLGGPAQTIRPPWKPDRRSEGSSIPGSDPVWRTNYWNDRVCKEKMGNSVVLEKYNGVEGWFTAPSVVKRSATRIMGLTGGPPSAFIKIDIEFIWFHSYWNISINGIDEKWNVWNELRLGSGLILMKDIYSRCESMIRLLLN